MVLRFPARSLFYFRVSLCDPLIAQEFIVLLISGVVFATGVINSAQAFELRKTWACVVALSRFAETLTNNKGGDNYA